MHDNSRRVVMDTDAMTTAFHPRWPPQQHTDTHSTARLHTDGCSCWPSGRDGAAAGEPGEDDDAAAEPENQDQVDGKSEREAPGEKEGEGTREPGPNRGVKVSRDRDMEGGGIPVGPVGWRARTPGAIRGGTRLQGARRPQSC